MLAFLRLLGARLAAKLHSANLNIGREIRLINGVAVRNFLLALMHAERIALGVHTPARAAIGAAVPA